MLEGLLNPNRWKNLFENMDDFWDGMLMTLKVALIGLLVAVVIGIVIGMFSASKNKVLRGIARVYVEFFQNTPIVVQVFFYYNGVPKILQAIMGAARPLRLSKLLLGVMGVGLYHGAYIAEVIRTGIESVSKGQYEAAHAQGFSDLQTMAQIILPQTIKVIMPPLANQALNFVKNTSVLAMVAGFDLMYFADKYVGTTTFIQGYILCALLYFVICFPLSLIVRWLENRSKRAPGTTPKRNKKLAVKE